MPGKNMEIYILCLLYHKLLKNTRCRERKGNGKA
nr:MAG TPA: hypothetical protein [Caudoviricetes sp.]